MKHILLLLLASSLFVLSAFKKSSDNIRLKEVVENYVKVQDNLWFCKYETSNKEYRNYLSFLRQTDQQAAFVGGQLDTSKWILNGSVNMPMALYYHAHKAYDDYPVVTATYDNAVNYCNWLTAQYNANPRRKFSRVIFRLPTEKEWVYAASAGKDNRKYPWEGNYLRNKTGMYLANFKRINDGDVTLDSTSGTLKLQPNEPLITKYMSKRNGYFPNEFGLYNMAGNVAEMVKEKGIAKGGSYNDPGYDIRIEHIKKYTTPLPDLGFRVVMELVQQ